MADRPINCSAFDVRAILDGRKMQTRRVLKPQPPAGYMFVNYYAPGLTAVFEDTSFEARPDHTNRLPSIGDRLWVRETWKPHSAFARMKPSEVPQSNIFYRADDRYAPSNTPWMPSIYMPRWASRLTLKVTGVKIERVQEISEKDAKAEGIRQDRGGAGTYIGREGPGRWVTPWLTATEAFADLWNSINAKRGYGWEQNPWVTAITFEVIKANIDQLPEAA